MEGSARHLIEQFDRGDRAEKPFGLYIVDGSSPFAELGRAVECEVFGEFFQNDSEELRAEYGPFDASSTFITLIDHTSEEPAGVIRVLRDSPVGLKSVNDFASVPEWSISIADIETFHGFTFDALTAGDIATLALRDKYRLSKSGTFASMGLYHGLYWESIHGGYARWFGVLDKVVFELMHSMGVEFEIVCELPPATYLGSPLSLPVMLDTDRVRRTMRDVNAGMASMMIDGVGIHEQVSFPDIILDSVGTGADMVIDLRDSAEQRTDTPATAD